MKKKRSGANHNIRYSEAFKLEVVRELERDDLPYLHVARQFARRAERNHSTLTRAAERSSPDRTDPFVNVIPADERPIEHYEPTIWRARLDFTFPKAHFPPLTCKDW